jgi:hypothetical protein
VFRLPSIVAADPDDLLRVLPQAQFGCREQAIDDVVVSAEPVVDEFIVSVRAHHEERRLSFCALSAINWSSGYVQESAAMAVLSVLSSAR